MAVGKTSFENWPRKDVQTPSSSSSISYGIVERHGGELAAGNHPAGGAVLSVTLQRADPGGNTASG